MIAYRRKRMLAVSWLALALLGCAGAGGAETGELRVLVYNIHAGKDGSGEHNLQRVSRLVLATDADLVLLQEVDRGTSRSGGEDQPATLASATGRAALFGKSLDYQGGEYGNATLARWPADTSAVRSLIIYPPQQRAGGSYEPRSALIVSVGTPRGRLHAINTHLDASGDDHYRMQEVGQLRALADSLQAVGGLVVVGGDFNAEPGTPVIEAMTSAGWRDAGAECGAGEGFTFPATDPIKRIDYLFIGRGLECVRAEVIETATSDHRPLLVVLRPAR